MKHMSKTIAKRMAAMVLCIMLLAGIAPPAQAVQVEYRKADVSTANQWQTYFGDSATTTENAGGLWTDKTVYDSVSQLNSELGVNLPASALGGDDRFIVALSAIASSKSITGHSTIPTDTVFVLDMSGSMSNDKNNARVKNMVDALNTAIQTLMDLNVENRVGVVYYWGSTYIDESSKNSSKTAMSLGRYKAVDGKFLELSSSSNADHGFQVDVVAQTEDGQDVANNPLQLHNYATYIQNGLLRSWTEIFSKADNKVPDTGDPLQKGARRMPIMVLMSDGAPTAVTSNFTSIEESDGGNSRVATTSDDMGFVTMLTASWVREQMRKRYNADGNGHDPLFYTLGLALDTDTSGKVAKSIMDPAASTKGINDAWAKYLALSSGKSMNVTYQQPNDGSDKLTTTKSVDYNAEAASQYYVNRYFPAENADALYAAFEAIVQEIILQSLYYPTHTETSTPEHDGYLTFVDDIGPYMEVKEIEGIIYNGKLYTGQHFASMLNNHDTGMGTVDNPTLLGDEFIRSVRSRLHLTKEQAQQLVDAAYNDGQFFYNAQTGAYGNSIGWYVGSQGEFLGMWKKADTAANVPNGAVYRCRSYGFLNEGWKPGVNENLMYVTVQVHTEIATGHNTVVFKAPATMIPLITNEFTITDLNNPNSAITRKHTHASPIRLLYEAGLQAGISEQNVEDVVGDDPRVKRADGSYAFLTNEADAQEMDDLADVSTPQPHDLPSQYNNTIAFFNPSRANERYFYTTDTSVYTLNADGSYQLYTGSKPQKGQTFYAGHTIFDWSQGDSKVKKVLFYEQITDKSLESVQKSGSGWIIPKGTVRRQMNAYAILKPEGTSVSPVNYAHFPFALEYDDVVNAATLLGNNGIITLKPARIKLTVDALKQVSSTGDLTLSPEGFQFELVRLDANGLPTTEKQTAVSDENGAFSFDFEYASAQRGTHQYQLKEMEGENGRVTYCPFVYTLTVTVGYSTQGMLQATPSWTSTNGGLLQNGKPLFTNDYDGTVTPDEVTVTAKKIVDSSGHLSLGAEGFRFQLQEINAQGQAIGQPMETVSDANGGISFRLVYHNADIGTHLYELTEVEGDNGRVSYSDDVFRLTVQVVRDANLNVQVVEPPVWTAVKGSLDAQGNPVFTNGYDGEVLPASLTVSGKKQITASGQLTIGPENFLFQLQEIDAQNQAVGQPQTAVSNAEGAFSFTLGYVYGQAGTHRYLLTEQKGDNDRLTYSDDAFLLTVEVGSDENLNLRIDSWAWQAVRGQLSNGAPLFTNGYDGYVPPIALQVEGLKQVKNKGQLSIGPEDFLFELVELDALNRPIGEPVTSISDLYGRFLFTLTYENEDVGTHRYLLTEKEGEDSRTTYSKAQYVLTVEVGRDENLYLEIKSAEWIGGELAEGNKPLFINHYDGWLPLTGDATPLAALIILCLLSGVMLIRLRRKEHA